MCLVLESSHWIECKRFNWTTLWFCSLGEVGVEEADPQIGKSFYAEFLNQFDPQSEKGSSSRINTPASRPQTYPGHEPIPALRCLVHRWRNTLTWFCSSPLISPTTCRANPIPSNPFGSAHNRNHRNSSAVAFHGFFINSRRGGWWQIAPLITRLARRRVSEISRETHYFQRRGRYLTWLSSQSEFLPGRTDCSVIKSTSAARAQFDAFPSKVWLSGIIATR